MNTRFISGNNIVNTVSFNYIFKFLFIPFNLSSVYGLICLYTLLKDLLFLCKMVLTIEISMLSQCMENKEMYKKLPIYTIIEEKYKRLLTSLAYLLYFYYIFY
jgi:hypothetical protein